LEIAKLGPRGLDNRLGLVLDVRECALDGIGEKLLDLLLDRAHDARGELEDGHLGRLAGGHISSGGSTTLIPLVLFFRLDGSDRFRFHQFLAILGLLLDLVVENLKKIS